MKTLAWILINHQKKKFLKRRLNKICKNCNRKKRKNVGNQKDIGCCCVESDKSDEGKDITNPSITKQPLLQSDNPEVVELRSKPNSTISRNLYNELDAPPYIIHVQKIQSSDNDGTILHPITFGNFLLKNKIYNVVNGSVKRIGRNRMSVSFTNYLDANSFINNSIITENNYKAYVPSFNILRIGVIKGVPTDWSPEEIMSNISTPVGCGKIVKIRRLNYKTIVDGSPTWKPTQSVVVYFDGKVLPKRIFICYNSLPVDLYVFPTIQCYHCCRYGHTKLQCRSKPRCLKCGQDHVSDTCNIVDDYYCCQCSGQHMANSKSCPELKRQKEIKLYMSQNCVSYQEASKIFPTLHKSFAEVLSSPQRKLSFQNVNSNSTTSYYPQKSYKKTVISKSSRPIKVGNGYDKTAHDNIIKEFCFNEIDRNYSPITNDSPSTQEPIKISDIISLLQTFAQTNNNIPSIAAPLMELLVNLLKINNGQQNYTMEC